MVCFDILVTLFTTTSGWCDQIGEGWDHFPSMSSAALILQHIFVTCETEQGMGDIERDM